MKTSVIVPCYNEGLHIKKCIDSLLQNTYDDKEIIVVNDGSTDDTTSILSCYDSIKVINIEKKGLLYAIRTGVENALGEIILKIDADSIAPSDWITKLVKHFDNPNNIIVGGIFKNTYAKGGLSIGQKCLDEIYQNILERRLSTCKISGSNWATRSYLLIDKKLFENIVNDESLLLNIMKSHEGKVIFDKQIYVTINSPKNLTRLWQRKYIWGRKAVIDKRYKFKSFWIRPFYFLLFIIALCSSFTPLGIIFFSIILLPLIFLIILSINSFFFLFTPLVFLISEFAFVYGNTACFIDKLLKKQLWK